MRWILALALCAFGAAAHAQGGLTLQPLGPFCSLSSLGTPTGLVAGCGGIPQGATYAVVCAYNQAVVWRDDGPPPTATPGAGGQGLSAGNCMPYNGRMSQIQFIQQAGGAVVGVTFYK